jgi:uncharacterized protein YraI
MSVRTRIRVCAVLALVAGTSSGLVGSALTSATAQEPPSKATTLRWGHAQHLMPAIYTVACGAPDLCVAGNVNGKVSINHGHGWSRPRYIDKGGTIENIACTSTQFCMAVTADVMYDYAGRVMQYNGRGWAATDRFARDGFNHVECASKRLCLAGTFGGGVSIYDGDDWTPVEQLNRPGFRGGSITWNQPRSGRVFQRSP